VSLRHRTPYPRGKRPDTHFIRDWLDAKAGLDDVSKRKIPIIAHPMNGILVVQTVA